MEDEEVLKDIQARVKKYIEDFISAEFAELAGEEVQKFMEATGIFAEQAVYSLEEVMEVLMNALNGGVNPKRLRREFFRLAAGRDREKSRETDSRFRQYKAGETAWAARKRTGQRQREWRGPWRDAKRTN